MNISVIVLCSNNQYINLCINSIIPQLSKDDEIIIVNDHSNEELINRQIVPILSEHIKLIHIEEIRGNRAHNRNIGIQSSKNPYILLVDGDIILKNHSISTLKNAVQNNFCNAYIGQVSGINSVPEQLSLALGNLNYKELIQSQEGLTILMNHPQIKDSRLEELSQKNNQNFYWIYFYTCLCAVDKEYFQKIGGFDERFITWGSEDVDLGYRLGRTGTIGFLKDLAGFHMPHPRNMWKRQIYDRDNIHYMLDKYKTLDIEILYAYNANCTMYRTIYTTITKIAHLNLPYLFSKEEKNSCWINVPTTGNLPTIVYYNANRRLITLNLLGIALPFCDKRFEQVHISSNIFAYPNSINCKILMESIRIGHNIYIHKNKDSTRISWDDSALNYITEQHHVALLTSDLSEYSLKQVSKNIYKVSSSEIEKRYSYMDSRFPIVISAKTKEKCSVCLNNKKNVYCLINLSSIKDILTIIEKLESNLPLKIVQHYTFNIKNSDEKTLWAVLPSAVLMLKNSLLIIVDQISDIVIDHQSKYLRPNYYNDYILDIDGEIYTFDEISD